MLTTLALDSCNEQFDSCQKVYPADTQNGPSLTGLDTDSEYRPIGVLLAARLSEPAEYVDVPAHMKI
jgi:hypothetical protein